MTQEEQIKAMLDKLNIMLEYDEDIAVDSVDEIVDKFNEYVEENIPYKSYYKRKEASYDNENKYGWSNALASEQPKKTP